MTPPMFSAVNSFSANLSESGYLRDAFHADREGSPRPTPTVIGGLSFHRDRFPTCYLVHDLMPLRRDTAARLGGIVRWDVAGQGIDHVSTIVDAVFALKELDLPLTAKRIAHLESLCSEDPDEPDVDLESLKRLVRVMRANPAWGEPSLALADGGCIHAEWPVDGGGRVTISFLPSNRVDYTASSAPVTDDDALDIAGRHLEGEALQNLRWFTGRIVAR